MMFSNVKKSLQDVQMGTVVGASIVYAGERFCMVANIVDVVPPDEPLIA